MCVHACVRVCVRTHAYMHKCVIVLLARAWIFGMTVVPEEQKIYYADCDDNSINMLCLKTRKITVLISQLDKPRGFAMDRSAG